MAICVLMLRNMNQKEIILLSCLEKWASVCSFSQRVHSLYLQSFLRVALSLMWVSLLLFSDATWRKCMISILLHVIKSVSVNVEKWPLSWDMAASSTFLVDIHTWHCHFVLEDDELQYTILLNLVYFIYLQYTIPSYKQILRPFNII